MSGRAYCNPYGDCANCRYLSKGGYLSATCRAWDDKKVGYAKYCDLPILVQCVDCRMFITNMKGRFCEKCVNFNKDVERYTEKHCNINTEPSWIDNGCSWDLSCDKRILHEKKDGKI